MPILSREEAQAELALVAAVNEQVAGAETYPYTRLSADDFERLAYALFAVSSPPGDQRSWEHATIMVRGADAGRDVVLMADGALVGVVQCKRLETAIALPAVLRELAKLILFPLADSTLPKIEADLTYYLALAHECAGTVITFFDHPKETLATRDADLAAAVRETLECYTTLKDIDPTDAIDHVKATLPTIKYRLLRPVSIDNWVSKETGVATRFFRHRLVVEHEHVNAQYSQMMGLLSQLAKQTEGVALLTDSDLAHIKERIESVPESHRVSLGVASLFGFPREMFVGDENLQRRLAPLSSFLTQLGTDFIDWIFERSTQEAATICESGDVTFNVHPFARQVPIAFLGQVARDVSKNALSGRGMIEIWAKLEGHAALATDDERLAYVRRVLLESGRRYLRGDFSELKGDASFKSFKRNFIQHLMRGLPDEQTMVSRLDEGIEAMRKQMWAAAARLREVGAYQPCVFISGTPGLDDPKAMERMAATVKMLEELKKKQE